ncbi:MAG: response regulator [Ignavibacteria bacterium]|nr:response regulator [Ignavibacteria bacterium]
MGTDNLTFLIADNDKSNVSTIRAILARFFPNSSILFSFDGTNALNTLQKQSVDLLIADYNLPQINGLELCQKIRSESQFKNIYYILTANYIERNLLENYLQNYLDDFVEKPIEYSNFFPRIRAAARIVKLRNTTAKDRKLINDLAKALETQIQDTKQLAIRFINLRMPSVAELLKNVARASVWVAKLSKNFDDDEISEIEFASYLAYVGKLSLPDSLLETPVLTDGAPTNELMCQVPIKAKELIDNIGSFDKIPKILYHIFENFDGSGIPKKLQAWQIPPQSRIIRVALDFEELRFFKKMKADDALEKIKQNSRRLYDPKVVLFFEHFLLEFRELESSVNEKPIPLQDLKAGLIVSRDVYTYSGIKLVPAGSVLTEKSIQLLISHNTTDSILGNVWVQT